MSSPHSYNPEFPFSGHTRAADREQLLAGIVATVWESVLGLPVLLRAPEDLDGHAGGPTLSANLHIRLTYSHRVPGARILNELTFACLGKRIRVTALEQDTAARWTSSAT